VNSSLSQIDIDVKIYNDKGKGLGIARQIIVDNASGIYIVWVDGDIILPKNYLHEQVEFMEQNPKLGAAQGQWGISKTRTLAAALDNLSSFITFIIFERESKKSSLNSLGSVGGIYRVEAVRYVGGYDKNIEGAAEDRDLTARMRSVGWLLSISQAKIYHMYKETWNGVWNKYSWWGYGDHYLSHKHKGLVILWQKNPIVTFLAGFLRSISIYKKTYQKKAFLLPFHNYFRSIAWSCGFIESHLNNYGHD
jgi:cellulose synthase/poly-beta-1,6-N-acetylglucosamine synthase-like glycosyltransferase